MKFFLITVELTDGRKLPYNVEQDLAILAIKECMEYISKTNPLAQIKNVAVCIPLIIPKVNNQKI